MLPEPLTGLILLRLDVGRTADSPRVAVEGVVGIRAVASYAAGCGTLRKGTVVQRAMVGSSALCRADDRSSHELRTMKIFAKRAAVHDTNTSAACLPVIVHDPVVHRTTWLGNVTCRPTTSLRETRAVEMGERDRQERRVKSSREAGGLGLGRGSREVTRFAGAGDRRRRGFDGIYPFDSFSVPILCPFGTDNSNQTSSK